MGERRASPSTVSLRGRGVDVSGIAERYGGGGHARAAAFTFRASPLEEDLLGFDQRAHRVRHQSIVGERDTRRTALRELVQRHDRLLEVEVGRRRRRAQHAGVGQAHAHGVTDEEDPAL